MRSGTLRRLLGAGRPRPRAVGGKGVRYRLGLAPERYPRHLEHKLELGNGTRLWVRPIKPEDASLLIEGFGRLSPEDVRFRFLAPMSALSPELAERLSRLDYQREMALVALDRGRGLSRGRLRGVVRLIGDPESRRAEFAIVIDPTLKGSGLAQMLMEKILDFARTAGTAEVWGYVLSDNRAMLRLCERLGFARSSVSDEPGTVRVSKRLEATRPS